MSNKDNVNAQENQTPSLLRYRVICCAKDMQNMFEDNKLEEEIEEAVKSFFESLKTGEIISILTHNYYVEIDFQALPSVAPSDIVSKLKSSTSKKILKSNPAIKAKYAGLWSNSYFIYTLESK